MKQKLLVKELYKAQIDHNQQKIDELRKQEFKKIVERKNLGRKFTSRWAIVNI
jgi:hypothetical protein